MALVDSSSCGLSSPGLEPNDEKEEEVLKTDQGALCQGALCLGALCLGALSLGALCVI